LVGPDGPTHHGVYDISMLINLPNIVVAAPRDGNELDSLLATALESNVAFCIRYPKSHSINYDNNIAKKIIDIGSWEYLREGDKVAILAVGSTVDIAEKSLDLIKEKFNFIPTLVNCRFIKPFDDKILNDVINKHKFIITMEEGIIKGGFGVSVLNYCHNKDSRLRVKNLGIKDEFIEHATRNELLNSVGLNESSIINSIDDFLEE